MYIGVILALPLFMPIRKISQLFLYNIIQIRFLLHLFILVIHKHLTVSHMGSCKVTFHCPIISKTMQLFWPIEQQISVCLTIVVATFIIETAIKKKKHNISEILVQTDKNPHITHKLVQSSREHLKKKYWNYSLAMNTNIFDFNT